MMKLSAYIASGSRIMVLLITSPGGITVQCSAPLWC